MISNGSNLHHGHYFLEHRRLELPRCCVSYPQSIRYRRKAETCDERIIYWLRSNTADRLNGVDKMNEDRREACVRELEVVEKLIETSIKNLL
jgi:hypothetical protein